MGSSASNVDNLERKAHDKIMQANNLISMIEGAGVEIHSAIGVCSECDEPTDSLSPHPDDIDLDPDEMRMICPDCQ